MDQPRPLRNNMEMCREGLFEREMSECERGRKIKYIKKKKKKKKTVVSLRGFEGRGKKSVPKADELRKLERHRLC